MIKSREIIPTSLEHALVANRVLAALASEDLTSGEARDAVADGLQLLKSMIHGQEFTASRSVSADSYHAALAYGEGVRAFEIVAYQRGGSDEPIVFLRKLANVATALNENQPVEAQAVQEFKNFFRIMRDIALASSERPVERIS